MMRSSVIVTLLSLTGSLLGFVVQLVLARRYGSGVQVDAYLYAISAPTFIAGLFSSLLSYTVVPRIGQVQQSPSQQNQLIASLFVLSAALALLLQVLSPFLKEVQLATLPVGSAINKLQELPTLLSLGWCIASVQIVLACLTAILVGLRRPLVATALSLGPYLAMLMTLALVNEGGMQWVAIGLLTGTVVAMLLAVLLLGRRIRSGIPVVAWQPIRSIVASSPYTMVAMSCFSAYAVVDSYWAPRFGDGALAALGYSQRIMIALGNLAVAGPSALLVPRFSELISAHDKVRFLSTLRQMFLIILAIVLTLALILFGFSEQIIGLMFMRGAFTHQDVLNVSAVLRHCLPGMVCMLLSVMALRVLYCFTGIDRIAAVLGVFWVACYFLLSGALIVRGPTGSAIAYSITWLLYVISLSIVILLKTRNSF